jgi:hypothetical protein
MSKLIVVVLAAACPRDAAAQTGQQPPANASPGSATLHQNSNTILRTAKRCWRRIGLRPGLKWKCVLWAAGGAPGNQLSLVPRRRKAKN